MKFLAFLAAAAGSLCAQQFMTGQAARVVIGQSTFTRQNPSVTQVTVGPAGGVAYANDTLFVAGGTRVLPAEMQTNRVTIFRNISGKFPRPKDSFTWDGNIRCPLCGGAADLVLGQTDFNKNDIGSGRDKMRTPTAVATDGRYLAVADTDNNRVLIWNSIPTSMNQPADVVLGQEDFVKAGVNAGRGRQAHEGGLSGPQGVWFDFEGALWVADTQNHRVVKWNRVPTQNGAPADLVLGASSLSTYIEPDLLLSSTPASASNMLNPVSVTVDPDGRVFVADLGHNRVLVWNRIPRQNGAPADFVLGQIDVNSTSERDAQNANNSALLCESNGTNSEGNPTYPFLCEATLNFPRFALSDGKRLFVADGGNNRVLVYNTIPTRSGQAADVVLGQGSSTLDQDSEPIRVSAADALRAPMGLAWDGVNLYVSDPYNMRVLVFTPSDQTLPITGVRNAFSREIFAVSSLQFTADPKENDEVTLKIGTGDTAKEYKYKAPANPTLANVITALVEGINAGAGDPLVFASPNIPFRAITLTSRQAGSAGNGVSYTLTFSTGAQLTGPGSGSLAGGQDAAKIAPGTIVSILGDSLADNTASAPENMNPLPSKLGGVEVYIDGIQAPLLFVSPTEIRAQMPWEVNDAYSVNAYVRIEGNGGVRTTTAIAVPVIPQNPGIFAQEGLPDPRPAQALHGSAYATGVVSVDGSIKAGDQAIVTISDRNYGYTVKEGDKLETIRDALVNQINADDPEVEAIPSTVYTRILLRARVPGAAGEGTNYSGRASDGANLIVTPLSPALCCSNAENAPITEANPARPGQLIKIYATGLGIVGPDPAKFEVATGWKYNGPANTPNSPIDAIAGGKTANVLFAGLAPGLVGVYELILQLNSDIPTNPQTQLTIAQDIFVSNIVTFPLVNPAQEEETQP